MIIRFERSVVDETTLGVDPSSSMVRRGGRLANIISRAIFGGSAGSADRLRRLAAELAKVDLPLLLVVGGAERGFGFEAIDTSRIDVLSFDVYDTPDVDFIADAHEIPLADSSVDAVVVQAVLEHVLDPGTVVSEIHRVLKRGGLVYAETPFMQQVHEGAYDFTRFTESGHRWLFRHFELIDSGVSRGPGTALLWSVRYAIAGVVGSKRIAGLLCLPIFWIRFLDRFTRPGASVDGASDLYFYGRAVDEPISPADIINHYRGGAG